MIQEGYKIVRLTGDPKVCVSAFGDGKEYKYKLNIWTKRCNGDGPFALFVTLQTAINFLVFYPIPIRGIYKCKYISSNDNRLWFTTFNQQKIINDGIIALPIGTLFADEVMLIEEVN